MPNAFPGDSDSIFAAASSLYLRRLSTFLVLAAALLWMRHSWAQETVTLNLKDADITAVIETVSEITGRNFIVDPRVKGKVTVVSSQPLAADEVYQVFLAILNVHGFAVIPGEGVEKIIPEVNAKQGDIPNVTNGGYSADQYVTRVIQVENVPAAQLVPVLRPLLPQQGHLAAYPESNVLIASATAGNVRRIVDLVERIDRSSDAEVELVRLEHASADEVVRILNALSQQQGKGQQPGEAPRLVADTRTNSVLLSGDKSSRLRLRALIAHLDTPLETTGNTKVVYLRYANAEDLVPVITGVSTSIAEEEKGKPKQAQTGKINIQADKSTNSLVITAPPDVMRDLEAVIRQLDVRRAQVLVEAVVAEVSADTASELGVQWIYDGSANNGPVGLINFGRSGSGLASIAAAAGGTGVPPDGITLGLGDTGKGGNRGGAVIRALSGDADTNILSTPTLVTMDNEEAEIVVGQNVPFVTGSYSSTGGGVTPTNPFQTIKREDIGLTLRVKPQINEGNAVKLEITQEVSSISSAASGAADIVTDKRSIKSTVMVDDGEVVVLGGLIDDQLTENVQKVPGLGDIPVIGWFFSYKRTSKVKRNLMVFLRPVIMRDEMQNAALTSEKYNFIRAQQVADRRRGVALMPDNVVPTLPELDEWMELPPPFERSKLKEPEIDAPPGAGETDGGTD